MICSGFQSQGGIMVFRSLCLFILLILQAVAAKASLWDGESPVRAVVFEDNFESPLLRGRPDRWRGTGPAWSIAESNLQGLAQLDLQPLTRECLYLPGAEWKDYDLLCRVRVARWGGQTKNFAWSGKQYRRVYWAVALRAADAANCYRLEYVPWLPEDGGGKQSFYRLVKYTGGQRSELARVNADFHSDLDYLVRFQAGGAVLRARVWPAGDPEPAEWTVTAEDSDHSAGTVGFLSANCSVLFGAVEVSSSSGKRVLLEEDFSAPGAKLPPGWKALSGDWRIAPWGKKLVRSSTTESGEPGPAQEISLPGEARLRVRLGEGGRLCILLFSDLTGPGSSGFRLELKAAQASLQSLQGDLLKKISFPLEGKGEYTLDLLFEPGRLKLKAGKYPFPNGPAREAEFDLPGAAEKIRLAFGPGSSAGTSVDDIVLKAAVTVEKALEEYLRYICDWYMTLELPTGYPKTGSGSPELFIASYCTRTLMAGAQILNEPAYLEEALRWADFVCTSRSVLVLVVTGTGAEAVALRTFADWSACINMADIGSVLLGVGVLCPWADSQRRTRYLDVMEKYSRYVTEGCLEDPLILGRGHSPQGWIVQSGPEKGGIINGYWWMEKSEEPWDISTTNVGLQFYSILYRLTGDENYLSYAQQATDWYLRKEVETGAVFENFHDVIYGGEALLTAFEHSADGPGRERIESAVGSLCRWIVKHQNPDGTWNQKETPRNNRTNLVWHLLHWYASRHPEEPALREALLRTVAYHLDRRNSRSTGICEVLRKTCFTGASVADLLSPGITIRLRGDMPH